MGQDRATPPIDREEEKERKKSKTKKKERGKEIKTQKDRKKVIYNDKTIAARHGRHCMYQAGVCAHTVVHTKTNTLTCTHWFAEEMVKLT